MIGDRVIIGGSGILAGSDMVVVYGPRRDAAGEMIWDKTGTIASVERLGGVKAKSTGTIAGPPIRVQRTDLIDSGDRTPGLGGYDLIDLYPIHLDEYQKVGWFPADNMRVALGDPTLDRKI